MAGSKGGVCFLFVFFLFAPSDFPALAGGRGCCSHSTAPFSGAQPTYPLPAHTRAPTRGPGRGLTWRQDYLRTDVKHGRFSDEEKAALRGSAASYARANGLDAEDLSWLADVRGSGKKGAMSEIVAALPNRTRKASWACLLRLLAEGRGQVRPGAVCQCVWACITAGHVCVGGGGSEGVTWGVRPHSDGPSQQLFQQAQAAAGAGAACCAHRASGRRRRTRSFASRWQTAEPSGRRLRRRSRGRPTLAGTAGARSPLALSTRVRRAGLGVVCARCAACMGVWHAVAGA